MARYNYKIGNTVIGFSKKVYRTESGKLVHRKRHPLTNEWLAQPISPMKALEWLSAEEESSK